MSTSQSPELTEELESLRAQVKRLDRERAELKRARQIQSRASQVLERLAAGASLGEVLCLLVRSIQETCPAMIGSVLLLDEDGRHLREGAAPDLPDFYNEAINGVEIGPAVGSCGTCAYTGERVIVEDVMTHPYWADFREVAERAGLRACWSHPITAATGRILGTFAMYYREPRGPDRSDLELITFAAHLAGIAIERKETEQALRRSEHRFRALVECAPVCIHEIDLNGRLCSMNATGLEMLGVKTADEIVGTPYLDCVVPAERDRVRQLLERACMGQPAEFEFTAILGDNLRIVTSSLVPLKNQRGEVMRVMGVSQDITERKEAERRQTLMIQELDHRVKNNLAAVLSIAAQTIGGSESLDDFDSAFTGRIQSLAAVHEMLAHAHWEGVEFGQLLGRILEPYRRRNMSRISMTGSVVVVPARIAAPMCMIIHELVTNAAKYGALTDDKGRVLIGWAQESFGDDERALRVTWEEVGGPPVSPPKRQGRGTTLIERMVSYQLHGDASIDFSPYGVKCEMTVPLTEPKCDEDVAS